MEHVGHGASGWYVRTMQSLLIVMGVSGSGKTTIGMLLATELAVPFTDADDLHSEANIAKMAAGHPLTDDDRWPWLQRVGEALRDAEDTGLVIACSALKRSYRELILRAEPRALFVFLDGSRELLERRLEHRHHHFMLADMLDSQFAALEHLAPDEPGVTVSIDDAPSAIVEDILGKLRAL